MLTVMTIVGTRPEIIKLSRVIAKLDKFTNHILVHTGQNYDYELNEIFFSQMQIRKPDYFLNAVGETVARTIGNIISSIDDALIKIKPDAVLVYGDTNSCLSVITAKRRKIPIFHMEAGNRCFDQRVPEELNRKIVDHLSDINMTITEHARRYLLDEGIKPETIIKTGSCMFEVLNYYKQDIQKSLILTTLNLQKNNYFVLSVHREENVDFVDNFNNLLITLHDICNKYNKRIIFSAHPRTIKTINAIVDYKLHPMIEIMKPLGFFDYINLQMNAFCTISDSGTITEEAAILGFPAITIRNAHERPEGMDDGILIMSGLKSTRVIDSINIATCLVNEEQYPNVDDYNVANVSDKVVKIIQSYTDYIKRTVWHIQS